MNKRENIESGGVPAVNDNTEAGMLDAPVSRAKTMKLFGATITAGALAAFLPSEADAAPNKRRRRRRRRLRRRRQAAARRRRQNNVTSDTSTVNFGGVSILPGTRSPAETVTISNVGPDTVTINPQVVGDGFSLGDLSGLDLILSPGETVSIPVVVDARNALSDGVKTGQLRILDDSDGLLLETVDLVADVNVL